MRRRAGNYTMLLAVTLVSVLGFAALVLDTSYVLLVHEQSQAVADAAGQAAMVAYRNTGDRTVAREAAERVVAQNQVAGEAPSLQDLTFGSWDDTVANPTFDAFTQRPNAARATVGRAGGHAVPYLLAPIWGHERFDVDADSVSASRSVQVALVLDITGSWGESDFNEARAAVLLAVDLLSASATDVDEVALTIFTNRYAWAYTEFTHIALPAQAAQVRASWELLTIASKGGVDGDHTDGVACTLHPIADRNDFESPAGGCYPQMPREYTDEPGTDHSTGILLAQQLFEEHAGGANYRAMIVLTDGRPNDLGAESGSLRADEGHVESRWRQYVGPVPRSKDAIRAASIASTHHLHDTMGVNTWVVSLVAHDEMMPAMVTGDGSYTLASQASELAGILAQIISELPMAVVE